MTNETEEEFKVDRTGWAAGPWDSEPDKLQWVDEATSIKGQTFCVVLDDWLSGKCTDKKLADAFDKLVSR